MASVFWTLEDGRTLARRWSLMALALRLITDELKEIENAVEFYYFLEGFVIREDKGDEYNGYGGFIRQGTNIMFNFDLRTFAPENRTYFWQAAQNALSKIKEQKGDNNEQIEYILTTLLDMHNRIQMHEDPMHLNDLSSLMPETHDKIGPGW